MKLYEHQQNILTEDRKKIGLFLGTGTGKTRTALMLSYGSVLVIAPKTQVEDKNWEREKQQLHKELEVADPRVYALDLTVISKETFRKEAKNMKHFDTVIVDEAHTCLGVTPNVRWKNRKPVPRTSQLFEELKLYIERTHPNRLYLCTATIMRSPMTVWGAATILGHDLDYYKFRDAFYFQLPMPGRPVYAIKKDTDTKERLAELVKKIGHVGRLEDFFDVPEQTYKTIPIELTAEQKKRIKDMALEYPEPIVRIGKVHQIENGVLAGDEFTGPESFENGKITALLELAYEFPRMIVFAKYRAQIEAIREAMEKTGRKVFTLTGDTPERGKVLAEAASLNEYVFIAQAQISAGWELPDCPVMVFASRTYSFVDYVQALGRIQRANNIKKNLYINLVVKGGVDEAVDKAIATKQDFDEKLYTGFTGNVL